MNTSAGPPPSAPRTRCGPWRRRRVRPAVSCSACRASGWRALGAARPARCARNITEGIVAGRVGLWACGGADAQPLGVEQALDQRSRRRGLEARCAERAQAVAGEGLQAARLRRHPPAPAGAPCWLRRIRRRARRWPAGPSAGPRRRSSARRARPGALARSARHVAQRGAQPPAASTLTAGFLAAAASSTRPQR